jgi:hypothetical protein
MADVRTREAVMKLAPINITLKFWVVLHLLKTCNFCFGDIRVI